jgi:DNA (cytosine-5)-methyltransferase 1
MNQGSLFSGIGGFDLASEWMGWNNSFHCEWNEFGQRILKYYWPKAISYEDITKTDFTIWRGKIDVLTGGFPCQPYSHAGKRLGKDDDRHLWPEMLRAIREIAPEYVVAENVLGIVSWNDGLVFNEVQADLEAEGYEVQPCVLPAAGVGAPHRRDRVWFIAHRSNSGIKSMRESKKQVNKLENATDSNRNDERLLCRQQPKQPFKALPFISNTSRQITPTNPKNFRCQKTKNSKREWRKYESYNRREIRGSFNTISKRRTNSNTKSQSGKRMQSEQRKISQQEQGEFRGNNSKLESKGNDTNTQCKRQQEQGKPTRSMRNEEKREWKASWAYHDGRWPTQSPICSGNDELSSRLDGITFPKWRNESIKGFGNAIVPEVALQIFKAIMETKNSLKTE